MPKLTRKVLRENMKKSYLTRISEMLSQNGEEVLIVGSNKIALPVVDEEGNEDFLTVTFSIPTGSRDDNSPYDGYGEAESYRLKCEENQRKAEEKERKKQEKIKRDQEYRKKKAEQKVKAEGKA